MLRCKECEKPLQEDFNVCPYCGFPTDKILDSLEEFPPVADSELEKELTAIAASADQMTRVMETPEEERANKEKNGELAQPLPDAGGREFGAPQSGPIQRQEEAAQALRRQQKNSAEDKGELRALMNGRTMVLVLLSVVVCVCIALIVVFGNINDPVTQMELGRDYLEAGQLEKAEKAFTTVLKQDKNNQEAIHALVDIKTSLNEDGSHSREIIRLLDKLEAFTADSEELKALDYRRIQLYTELGDKGNAEKLLKKYIELPVFTKASGTYSEDTLFEMTSESGTIYYTIDKDKTPSVYSGPIMLKPGSRQIKAWVQDENGLNGEKAEVFYYITAKASDMGLNEQKAERFLAAGVTKGILPEFSFPTGTVFDKMADSLFAFILSNRGQQTDAQVTTAELEETLALWFGSDFELNHRSAGSWIYEEAKECYTLAEQAESANSAGVCVLSAQEDIGKSGEPVLTVQVLLYTVDDNGKICHPLTGEAVLEASDGDVRAQLAASAEQLLTASVQLGMRPDGGLYYISCRYVD